MGRIIGIDLGTTYSAVALPQHRTDDGFFTIEECPGVSIILDKVKHRITPSVVAETPKGEIVVGYAAKGRVGFTPPPIMFAKRSMGEDITFPLDKQGALRPEEVSAHILRYLKTMAEERLGETVDEAVITVPAYFSGLAKQMTETAGELAEMNVAQVAQEPVAAALMYCANDQRDPLRIMTYDLGGGTFDIAILEKRDGTISTNSVLAFDGDRHLGGYDFDKALALWLEEQLCLQGYDLHLDYDNPDDQVIFARLMVYAEQVKIGLSKQEVYELQDPAPRITDHAGEDIGLALAIPRETFEDMIRRDVEKTIALCHRAMGEKADRPIAPEEIDEIIMVGGSSRIPLITERLTAEFGREPRLVEPDLCVALGAGILAGTKAVSIGRLKLDPPPPETDLPDLVITGRVLPAEGESAVRGCTVALSAADGSYQRTQPAGDDGGFFFDGVPLAPDSVTDFAIGARNAGGQEIASHSFSVRQTAAPTMNVVETITNVLAKPLCVLFADGPRVIAPARTPLPYEKTITARTADTSGEIRVPILEDNYPLSEIVMTEIPANLQVGSAVEVTLTLQQNYQIVGRAYVPALSREAEVVIQMTVPPRKDKDELAADLEAIRRRAEDVLATADPGVLFARGRQLKDGLAEVTRMLCSPILEPAKIQDALDELDGLIRTMGAGWRPEPPRAVFDAKCQEALDILARVAKSKPEVAGHGYDKRLQAIQAEAQEAFTAQNDAIWRECFEKVAKLCDDLDALDTRSGGGQQADPAQLLIALARELNQLEEWARAQGLLADHQAEFAQLAADLKAIDPQSPTAMTHIRDWYFSKFDDFRKRLQAPTQKIKGLLEGE